MNDPDIATQPTWADHLTTLTDLARLDLREHAELRPTLIAFRGEEPLFLATLRPFPRGGHLDPIVEIGALATALVADRLALSLSGRAWSTDDPIPPVVRGVGDLRQAVMVVHAVDGTVAGTPTAHSSMWPVTTDAGGQPSLGEVIDCPGAMGWVPEALAAMTQLGDQAPAEELVGQLLRCERLGHQLAWGTTALLEVVEALDALGVDASS